MALGDRIKYYRERSHLRQEDVARQLDTTPQNIYKYEKGIIQNIPVKKLRAMAKIFNITFSELMGWNDHVEPHDIDIAKQQQQAHQDIKFADLSDLEKRIIKEYRAKPDYHNAIHRLLGISTDDSVNDLALNNMSSYARVASSPLKPYNIKKHDQNS